MISIPHLRRGRRIPLLLMGAVLLSLLGCQTEAPPSTYVARVGDHYLTAEEVDRRLAGMGPMPDSTRARQQLIDQWITRTLLYREAQRLNLESVEEVQQKLEQQRRSTLITAMTNRMYEDAEVSPSQEEIRTYFERHREQLQLRAPYVAVRYLATSSRAAADSVRRQLQAAGASMSSSRWSRLVRTHAADTVQARRLSERMLPEQRLYSHLPFAERILPPLQEGEVTPVIDGQGRYHVLQLIRRMPEGTEPEPSWLEDEIRRRLRIRSRKQIYTHEVERLRSKARANDELETP